MVLFYFINFIIPEMMDKSRFTLINHVPRNKLM
jgi:hypothetical protein